MKTYKKETIEVKPRLEIIYDEWADSPREWSNLGYFITQDERYRSPDENEELQSIIKRTGNEAESQEEHMDLIKADFSEKIIAIYPVVKYEHGGVSYSLGPKHGFDHSNNGFYIITEESKKELGAKKKDFEKIIIGELERYTQWANGEIYSFILYDKNGEIEESCGGIYDIEDIRNYLPKEWKKEDLNEYLIE